MNPRKSALAIALGLLAIIPAGATTAATPLPVQSIAHGGDGCPQGSVGTSISNDRTTFTLIFDSFVASSGPGVAASEHTKTCRLDIVLTLPKGWHLTGATLDRRGYVQAPAGVTASADLTTTVDGRAPRNDTPVPFAGPVSKDYLARTTLQADRGLGRCNGATQTLSVLTSIAVQGDPDAQAQITNDSIDGKVTIAPCD